MTTFRRTCSVRSERQRDRDRANQLTHFVSPLTTEPCTSNAYNSIPSLFGCARERLGHVVNACANLGVSRNATLTTGETLIVYVLQDRHVDCKAEHVDYGRVQQGTETKRAPDPCPSPPPSQAF